MENQSAVNSKSKLEKISLICGLGTILLGFSGAIGAYFFKSKELAAFAILFSILLLLTGIVSGAIGLFTKRAWIGLIVNLILTMLVFILLFISSMFVCCQEPRF